MTSLINLAFDENGQKAAKIDLKALLNEDYRTVKPKPRPKKKEPPPPKVKEQPPRVKQERRPIRAEPDKRTVQTEKKTKPIRSVQSETTNQKRVPVRGTYQPNRQKKEKEMRPEVKMKNELEGSKSKVPQSDKFITLSEEQLNKLIGLVTSRTVEPDKPEKTTEPNVQPSVVGSVELTTSDLEPAQALSILQASQPAVPPAPPVRLSRDEQLKQSQKSIPLQMRSSFLPSEAVPRDVLAEQRKQKQLEWRRELEAQRAEDELRKKMAKEKEKKESMPDHHLFQSVADFGQTERSEAVRPIEIPKLQLSREMSNVSPRITAGLSSPKKSPLSGHHRNLATLKDPEELRRQEEARKRRHEHEELIRAQIEEKKRAEQARVELEDEENGIKYYI